MVVVVVVCVEDLTKEVVGSRWYVEEEEGGG